MPKPTISSADRARFVRAAETANEQRGARALHATDPFLDPDHWVVWCESDPVLYRVQFENLLVRALSHVLARPGQPLPPILRTLARGGEIERRFPRPALANPSFARATVAIRYGLARRVLHPTPADAETDDIAGILAEGFTALWELPGVEGVASIEAWEARETLADLAFGRDEAVLRAFEERHRFDLTTYEGSARTSIKACYLLARIATGRAGADERFGATALVALLRFQYYLWLVEDDADAEIDLVSLALLGELHAAIVDHRRVGIAESMAQLEPRAVVARMQSLQGA